ncbi:NYN domain-containing protein [Paenibacillus taichungensis]|jgi:uncharacterized LabA/DUF88 family protein
MTIRAAILVDEINAMHQLHSMDILGIRPWRAFFEAVNSVLKSDYGDVECHYHFYGAIPPKDVDERRYYDRTRFFDALRKDGIKSQKGICQPDPSSGRLQEKGVDVLLSLDIVDLARDQYDILFVFSGDADLVPAVQRARRHSKVVAIIRDGWPAKYMRENVDGVIPLELVVGLVDRNNLIPKINTAKNAV